MRYSLAFILVFYAGLANALWTGVAMEMGSADSDWDFSASTREAQISELSFRVEEKTNGELRVGASIGILDMRLLGDTPALTQKFSGEFIGVYLRLPVQLSQRISLHGQLNLGYHSGRESGVADGDNRTYLDWSEYQVQLGLSLRFGNFRIIPYAAYTDIDGDTSDDTMTTIFELDEAQSQGVRFDYYVEESAFIRLEFITGSHAGGYLTFARQY